VAAFGGEDLLLLIRGAFALLETGLGLIAGAFLLPLVGPSFQCFAEPPTGLCSVVGEGTAVLTFHLDACRDMLEKDAGGGLVDLLAAGPGTFDESLDQICLLDAEGVQARLDGGVFVHGVWALSPISLIRPRNFDKFHYGLPLSKRLSNLRMNALAIRV
jgi:hypothetical protein